jgi:hypothetical protein
MVSEAVNDENVRQGVNLNHVLAASGQKKAEREVVVDLGLGEYEARDGGVNDSTVSSDVDDDSSSSSSDDANEEIGFLAEDEDAEFSLSYALSEITDFVMDYSDLSISIRFTNLKYVSHDFCLFIYLVSFVSSSHL